ncbi:MULTISPECIES: hypothetical protein [unclassified Paenibacillus]|uniref:hypothetical protein n=1 Tax=unclassified Paenibacillus TaxID=185978 RepID=UPI001C0FED43|nr:MULTISPECIES: hypothetical protein [unclassified Paenibacillus]MBU5443481.1 hypothetical protein [Paenibacillus sp. MSJ-34]CAH0119369.1 hypothetical protein PAE9249_01869 [Paenibacillus sp. CECT 9249]
MEEARKYEAGAEDTKHPRNEKIELDVQTILHQMGIQEDRWPSDIIGPIQRKSDY